MRKWNLRGREMKKETTEKTRDTILPKTPTWEAEVNPTIAHRRRRRLHTIIPLIMAPITGNLVANKSHTLPDTQPVRPRPTAVTSLLSIVGIMVMAMTVINIRTPLVLTYARDTRGAETTTTTETTKTTKTKKRKKGGHSATMASRRRRLILRRRTAGLGKLMYEAGDRCSDFLLGNYVFRLKEVNCQCVQFLGPAGRGLLGLECSHFEEITVRM
jgi:hypothetical protein